MANTGNSFTVELFETHINWGTYRNTISREPVYGETYIPIPVSYARAFEIYNSNNNPNHSDILGKNIFHYKAYIGAKIFSEGILKASGCYTSGDKYAKNLSGNNNLKLLSPWIYSSGITVGDKVNILFTSATELELRKV